MATAATIRMSPRAAHVRVCIELASVPSRFGICPAEAKGGDLDAAPGQTKDRHSGGGPIDTIIARWGALSKKSKSAWGTGTGVAPVPVPHVPHLFRAPKTRESLTHGPVLSTINP